MNTLPGFVAEASLKPSGSMYRGVARRAPSAATVVCAQIARRTTHGRLGLRAPLGPVRDVTCCGLEGCWWSESVHTCLFELAGDVCETASCNEAGCVCTS
jgi:hypothetical protein